MSTRPRQGFADALHGGVRAHEPRAPHAVLPWVIRYARGLQELADTELQDLAYERSEVHREEHDWYIAWVDGATFHGVCGPMNLSELIHAFRMWAQG
jgi:hypothetical protein